MNNSRVMVLDAAYMPVTIVDWKKAICLVLTDKAEILEGSDDIVRTVSTEFIVPAVIRLLKRVLTGKKRVIKFNRQNIYKRDNYTCQYCGKKYSSKDLTWDHVIPSSRGGATDWENIVSACYDCNNAKDDKTPHEAGMKLLKQPKEPNFSQGFITADVKYKVIWKKWVPYIQFIEE